MSTNHWRVAAISAATLMLSAFTAHAQVQSVTQQACLNKLNKDGAAVAKARRGANLACLKKAGSGTLGGSAQACLTTDALGGFQNQKKRGKTVTHEAQFCGTPPNFGYTGAATVNSAAEQATLELTEDIFGGDLDAAVLSCATNGPGCKCQRAILGKLWGLAAAKLTKFVNCKRSTLRKGATSSAALVACVNDPGVSNSVAAAIGGPLLKKVISLGTTIVKKCDTPGVTAAAFPGVCNGKTAANLAVCLDTQVECRVCETINQMDGLFINCDIFDDGNANGSCASGSGPTPTPTDTPIPAPTPSPTETVAPGTFRGKLAATSGRFNYNLTLGIPGSDAACSSMFGGSHTCTYAELQAADALNQLVGQPDSAFWAIDSAQPFARQCNTNIPWDYATAHTGRFGDLVPLTGGHLGALMPSQICASSHDVGCCQ